MSFLEQIWEHLRSGRIQNYPYPAALNINMAYTLQLQDQSTNLIWLPFEFTGLCYMNKGHYVNIHPYYKGIILEDVDISRGTDLHKPKTEQDTLKRLYQVSWDIEQSIRKQEEQFYEPASAADYILKMYYYLEWLRYYNSTVRVGKA